ncbi:MAG: LuxR C-terminal-related transcriptional regulator [Solirubrobacterales bacterium]
MPGTSIKTSRPRTAKRDRHGPAAVALIAAEGPRERIGDILEQQGLEPIAFDGVEDLLEHCTEEVPTPIVLWLDDALSPLATQIEPLRQHLEGVPVVLICADIERWEVRTALASGVAGVVLAEEMTEALGPCLQAVQAGQICVPRRHSRQIEPPALSTREKQILGLVVMGYMNSQIAEQLFLAESTVKSHLSSAFGKLGVRSRNEAVKLILDTERGLGMGILALGGEPLEAAGTG